MQTLNQLKRRAQKHGFEIKKVRGGYLIIDVCTCGLFSYPEKCSLKGVEEFFDGMDGKWKENPSS